MTLLVTGGSGFVMSHVARSWLDSDPRATCVILDAAAPDAAADEWFAPVRDRLGFVRADVCDATTWAPAVAGRSIDRLVIGAAITPTEEREAALARRTLEVNIMGSVAALEWAVQQGSGLQRVVYVSSGAVYGHATGPPTDGLLTEDAPLEALDLYGVSKIAAEGAVERYRELFGLDAVTVRLTTIYGPMDRPTGSRQRPSVVCRLARAAVEGRSPRVAGLDGGGDWLHAADVGAGIVALLRTPRLRHEVYNVASGVFVTLGELVEMMRAVAPGFEVAVVDPPRAEVACDPAMRFGGWGAYDISRLRDDAAWQPVDVATRVREYLAWLRAGGAAAA